MTPIESKLVKPLNQTQVVTMNEYEPLTEGQWFVYHPGINPLPATLDLNISPFSNKSIQITKLIY